MVNPRHRQPSIPVFLVSFFSATCSLLAAEFYVAPSGTPGGSGSWSNPWDLQTALNQPATVHPGDTIWLRGGTYTGTHTSHLSGTSSSPIVVRQYAGERAILDGGNSAGMPILVIGGSYTWYWGFEVMSSDPNRVSAQATSWPSDIARGEGVVISQTTGSGVGTKFINLIVHDTRQGFSFWKEATDAEIYGCLIYYNGWVGPDDAHGHGIYAQNQTGTKKVVDSILGQQFGTGFHGYGSSAAFLNNLYLEGNTAFDNGKLTSFWQRNALVGGDTAANNPTLIANHLYYPNGARPYTALKLGYGAPCTNLTMSGNYIANNSEVGCTGMAISNNTFYGAITGFSQGQYPNNTYYASRPTGVKVFVRPNQFESGRAHITVFNWAGAATASVDLTGVLSPGSGFEIRNAQDFFGAPVLTGTYTGGSVSIPVNALSVAAPVGWAAPPPSGPEFNVFVLLPASPGGTPTPTPTGSVTATATPTPGPGGLPSPWLQADIGAVGLAGSATSASGTFAVSGSGTDIESAADQFHYVYQPLSGDGTVVARIASIQNTNAWAKGGVMIRESLSPSSTHAMAVLTPGNGIAFQRRKTTGGSTVHTGGAGVAAPYWVKLVRSGSTFTGYSSPDGTSWTQVGSDTIPMGASVLVGLALTSHNNPVLCAASMTSVAVTGGSVPTPTRTPTPGASTVLRLEAESGVIAAPMAVANDSGAFGGKSIATPTTDSGSGAWTFSAPASGTYYVWARVKAVNPERDSFYVKMDSGSEDVFDTTDGTWSPNWVWRRLNGRAGTGKALTLNPRTFSLSAGSHTLTFRGRETQTQLDRVIVTNDPAFVATEAP